MPLPEHPVATHDGMIWPIPRAEMVDAAAIRVRLAEDAAHLVGLRCDHRLGDRTTDDLSVDRFVALGWTEAQMVAHSDAAIDAVRTAIPVKSARPPQPDIRPLRSQVGARPTPAPTIAQALRGIIRDLSAVAADLDAATGEAASRGLATILLVGAVLGVAVVLA